MSCELLLPPGFRFHPTDEELIIHYLQNQATSRPCPVPIIPEINIYNFDAWELPGKSDMCDGEWYFFSPRDRKYPNGSRPNRGTKSGYWKATGTDKAIYSGSRFVGIKKALVFYKGRPPRGSKTDWIMHEYRLSTAAATTTSSSSSSSRCSSTNGTSMRLDDWVLCRIYHKGNQKKCSTSASDTSGDENYSYSSTPASEELQCGEPEVEEEKAPTPVLPRSCSIAHLLELGHDYISVSQLFDEVPYCSIDDLFNSSSNSSVGDTVTADFHAGRSRSAVIGRSAFVDPIFQHGQPNAYNFLTTDHVVGFHLGKGEKSGAGWDPYSRG